MKRLLFLALIGAAAYFAWQRFSPRRTPDPAAAAKANPETTPGANAKQRIDNLSGAAPE
jgi:hypothetical protein